MEPTGQQQANRLNPQPFTIKLPKEGQVFRGVGDQFGLFSIKQGKLTNIGQPGITPNTDLRLPDGTVLKAGVFVPGVERIDNATPIDPNFRGGHYTPTRANQAYEQQYGAGAFNQLPEFNIGDIQNLSPDVYKTGQTELTLNTQQNQLATPEQLAQAQQATQQQLNQDPNRVINQTTGQTAAQAATGQPAAGQAPQTPVSTYTGPSIVDYLASIGQPSDFASRAILAKNAGIQNYTGTANQNTQLLDTLRQAVPSTPVGGAGGGTSGGASGTPTGQQTGQSTVTTDTAPQVPQTPKTFADTYKEALDSTGVNSIKSEFDKVQKEYDDLQNELNDRIAEINDNPWISEGLRSKKIVAMQEKYDGKLGILTNVLKLYDSLHQQAQIEARFIASGTQEQAQFDENMQLKLFELAQKQSEALAKLDEAGFDRELALSRLGIDTEKLDLEKRRVEIAENEARNSGVTFKQNEYVSAGYAVRAEDSGKILDSAGGSLSLLDNVSRRQFNQATENFITAVLRKESGAAISNDEFDRERSKYIPMLRDNETELAQKKRAREVATAALKAEAGGAYDLLKGVVGESNRTSYVSPSGNEYSLPN